MLMAKQDLFFKYHWKSIATLFIVVLAVVSFQIIIEDTNLFLKKNQGTVKGKSTVNQTKNFLEQNNKKVIINYQNNLRNIVQNYLAKRSEFNAESQDWLFLINHTKQKLMNLRVPKGYKKLHIDLAVTLNLEEEAVLKGDKNKLENVNRRWKQILEQFYWLE